MQDAYSQFTADWNATADQDEREHDRLVSDLQLCLKRRHVADYRSDIAELISELRQFS